MGDKPAAPAPAREVPNVATLIERGAAHADELAKLKATDDANRDLARSLVATGYATDEEAAKVAALWPVVKRPRKAAQPAAPVNPPAS